MKILTLDIEMAPNIVHRWQLWGNDNTALSQLVQPQEMMCAAYKWLGDKQTLFMVAPGYADKAPKRHTTGNLQNLWEAFDEADILVTYNGKKFDVPRVNTAFVEAGLSAPSPYQHIDLYQVAKKVFGFPSNKLDYIAKRLLGYGKTDHQGHDLWVQCMAGDISAWHLMEEYNRQDVKITEDLYTRIKGWIPNHPNVLLYEEIPGQIACPTCGSDDFQRRGERALMTGTYIRYQCNSCKAWFRSNKRIDGTTVRG